MSDQKIRWPALRVALVLCLALATSGAASSTAQASKACKSQNLDGGLLYNIRATGTGCTKARDVAGTYNACINNGGASVKPCHHTILRFTCRAVRQRTATTDLGQVTCRLARKTVRFSYRELYGHRAEQNHQTNPVPPPPAFCANADLQPAPANFGLVRDATLCLVNQVRGQHGLGALTANATLEQIAQPYALRLVGENFFDHVTPNGQTTLDRFLLSGYFPNLPNVQHRYGENFGWGTLDHASPAMIVNAWIHSPVHLANILNAGFRESGIGVAMGLPAVLGAGPAGVTYVQEFGATQ